MRVYLRVDVIVPWNVTAFPSQVRRPLTALYHLLLLSHRFHLRYPLSKLLR
jgi:hypothetical protein